MANGVMMGECPICHELMWEDEETTLDPQMHTECWDRVLMHVNGGVVPEKASSVLERPTDEQIQEHINLAKQIVESWPNWMLEYDLRRKPVQAEQGREDAP